MFSCLIIILHYQLLFPDSQPIIGLPVLSPRIFLDDVQCIGNEASLLNCSRNSIGEHNCNQSSSAGVRCGGTTMKLCQR